MGWGGWLVGECERGDWWGFLNRLVLGEEAVLGTGSLHPPQVLDNLHPEPHLLASQHLTIPIILTPFLSPPTPTNIRSPLFLPGLQTKVPSSGGLHLNLIDAGCDYMDMLECAVRMSLGVLGVGLALGVD